MRLGFAGTPEFAATALRAVLDDGHRVDLVLTKPDRPQGRGLKLVRSAVNDLALQREITVFQPPTLRDAAARELITAHRLDLLIVAAYGLLLPPEILRWPRLGCVNIHASLLPRWRGAAPIHRAILAGDRESGITLMQMDEGLDTGPIIARYPVRIAPDATTGSLHEALAATGARAIVELLAGLRSGGPLASTPQPHEGITYAAKIDRAESVIDWNESAVMIERRVRAFDPSPGAMTSLDGSLYKIRKAHAAPGRFGLPGSVARADTGSIVVACGEGALIVRALQRAGGRELPVDAFLAGHPLSPDARFLAPKVN